jgi:hypothetical protein
MPSISLRPFTAALGSNSVSGMAQKVGLKWPPPPPISVRNLMRIAGQPLKPTHLVPQGGGPVTPVKPILNWEDPGVGSVRQATSWFWRLKLWNPDPRRTKVVGEGTVQTSEVDFTTPLSGALDPLTTYMWNVVPSNPYGTGPSSDDAFFDTE